MSGMYVPPPIARCQEASAVETAACGNTLLLRSAGCGGIQGTTYFDPVNRISGTAGTWGRPRDPPARLGICGSGQQTLPCGSSSGKPGGAQPSACFKVTLRSGVIWRQNCFYQQYLHCFLSSSWIAYRQLNAYFGGDPLRGKTKERWRELCERAVVEQNQDRFIATIQELIQELEDNEERRRNPRGLREPPCEKPAKLSWLAT